MTVPPFDPAKHKERPPLSTRGSWAAAETGSAGQLTLQSRDPSINIVNLPPIAPRGASRANTGRLPARLQRRSLLTCRLSVLPKNVRDWANYTLTFRSAQRGRPVLRCPLRNFWRQRRLN